MQYSLLFSRTLPAMFTTSSHLKGVLPTFALPSLSAMDQKAQASTSRAFSGLRGKMDGIITKHGDARSKPASTSAADLPRGRDINASEEFENYRQSANRHLKNYYRCLDDELNHDDPPGLHVRSIPPRNSEADENARHSQTNAIQDLMKLDSILKNIKRQKKPYIKAISPTVVAWTAFCFTLPYATSPGDLSILFKLGVIVGALSLTSQLVRKFLQMRRITPLQHKVRGLVRAFKNGTIRYRDLEEVMISPLN